MVARSFFRKASSVVLLSAVLFAPQSALAWGAATHVYIGKRLGHQFGFANTQEMYGAALPDLPALMFGYEHQTYLYTQTHLQFLKLVKLAPFGYQKAFAYGFAGHNEMYGADFTAHVAARTGGGGYVTQRVPPLANFLYPNVYAFLNGKVPHPGPAATELSALLADTCIESAVDLLVSENEFKEAGLEMMLASGLRAPFVPTLLVAAYAKGLAEEAGISESAAAALLIQAEANSRQYLTTYGAVLTQPNRRDLLAQTIAQLAGQMLAAKYGGTFDVPPSLVATGLNAAESSVQGDYRDELEQTLTWVGLQLRAHWIFTSLIP